MKFYCKIVDGEIVEGPTAVTGKSQQQLLSEGWLPHKLVENKTPDSVFLGSTWQITSTEVIETQLLRPMTNEEKNERDAKIAKENNEIINLTTLNNLLNELRTLVTALSSTTKNK